MRSFAHAVAGGLSSKYRPQLFAIFPSKFGLRKMGPDSNGKVRLGSEVLDALVSSGVRCIEYPLDQGFLLDTQLDALVLRHFGTSSRVFNITNGIGLPAYKQILIEALDQMPTSPDFVLVPVGAGVLFTECVDVICERNLKTRVIGVAVTQPDSIADKIYGLYSPFYSDLFQKGCALYRGDSRFYVQRISDEQIAMVRFNGLPPGFNESEPSAWACLVPVINRMQSEFTVRGVVLAVNTGNGLVPTTTDHEKNIRHF